MAQGESGGEELAVAVPSVEELLQKSPTQTLGTSGGEELTVAVPSVEELLPNEELTSGRGGWYSSSANLI